MVDLNTEVAAAQTFWQKQTAWLISHPTVAPTVVVLALVAGFILGKVL